VTVSIGFVHELASLTGGWDDIEWLVTIKTNGDVTNKTLGVKQGSDIECNGRSLDELQQPHRDVNVKHG